MNIDMQQVTRQIRFYISEIKSLQDKIKILTDKLKEYEGSSKEEFNPDNEKHMEIVRETEQAIKENSYGEDK